MASFPEQVKSTALIPYIPPPSAQTTSLGERIHNIYVRQDSIKTQLADCYLHTVFVCSYEDPSTGNDEKLFRAADGSFVQKTNQGPKTAVTVRALGLAGALPTPQIGASRQSPIQEQWKIFSI